MPDNLEETGRNSDLSGINIGIDIVDVSRIKSIVDNWGDKFLRRIFTDEEIKYCFSRSRSYEHLAGKFAAKEALIKALERKVPWRGIEVLNNSAGAPRTEIHIDLENELKERFTAKISISHTEKYAVAEAIIFF